jgi:phospho-N-acetylmuramoyl-pentapeptide-transferase
MFYYIFYKKLIYLFSPFNVFQYITFRAIYATVTALAISLILGPFTIERLRRMRIGQQIREDGPKSHFTKAGTPTMGGVLILSAIIISSLLWTRLDDPFVYVVLFSLAWFGGLGFLDDYFKVKNRRSLGLKGWHKIAIQSVGAFAIAYWVYRWGPIPGGMPSKTALLFPFFKNFRPDLGVLFIPFAMLVIVGTSNAVNLTDGLDGLAITCTVFVAGTYAVLSHITSNYRIADYLDIVHIPIAGELAIFCATIVGAGLGFLWYNCHPAEMFMGDVGALSLGAAIGTVAVLIKEELLLVIVGGVFVIEALSVIIQVWSYKLTGRRVFRMAPLHHHFEQKGWSETKVVVRFWIIAALFVLITLSTLKLR